MSNLELATEFIKDYESGKYGHAVRGEVKAFMYHQALLCEGEEQLEKLLEWSENLSIGDYRNTKDEVKPNAWVLKDGTVYYCDYGEHEAIARYVLFRYDIHIFEKEAARISSNTFDTDEALKYVENPTRIQKLAVQNIMSKTDRY